MTDSHGTLHRQHLRPGPGQGCKQDRRAAEKAFPNSLSSMDNQQIPLYVDLDNTLICTDLLAEGLLLAFRQDPLVLLRLPFWLLHGKAKVKEELAARVSPKAELLPYRAQVLELLQKEHAAGRKLVLATASPRPWAEAVARHIGLFDGVIATENSRNLKGDAKLAAIGRHEKDADSFAYMGDSAADMPLWKHAGEIYAVGAGKRLKVRLQRLGKNTVFLEEKRSLIYSTLKALRPHHWAKNLLLFLPLLLAHELSVQSFLAAALGFIAFSGAASATYITNDLLDIEVDRTHPYKQNRPFASGALPCAYGPFVIGGLLTVSVFAALPLPPVFRAGLVGYLVLTTLYSFWLKHKVLLDVFLLAFLYTLRILAGGWAVGVPISNWLLGMSVFLFTSIAFAKRAIELHETPADEPGFVRRRGYKREDLAIIKAMGVSSAYAAVLLLSLYISGDKVVQMYSHPNLLWLACPVLLYWLSRLWVKVHRGVLHYDPLLDAMKDPISVLCGILMVIIGALAL